MRMTRIFTWIVAPIAGIVLSLGLTRVGISPIAAIAQEMPSNARLVKAAWDAFNKGDWATAISKADDCINQFQDQADEQQEQLQKSEVVVPKGSVSAQQKKEILTRGPLNDVGTAFWIKGQALEKRGNMQQAITAYQNAAHYTYARCYDSSFDGFWSPAETATSRIKHLQK